MKLKINPQTAAAHLKKNSPLRLALAIVLGSGFHHALTELRAAKKISYAKIPGSPKPTVSVGSRFLNFPERIVSYRVCWD